MKSNKLTIMLMSLAIIAMPLILISCSSEDDSEDIDTPNQDKTEIRHNVSIENQLKNTSWKLLFFH